MSTELVELSQLWLPILLSAVVVFFVSFLMWMVFPHHRSDWKPAPDENKLMDALRELGVSGQVAFPHCSDPKQMKDPAWMEKYNKGPKGFLILKPEGPESMGKMMLVSGVFNLIATLLVAYVATLAVPAGAEKMFVFRVVWTVSFMAYAVGLTWGPIWFGRSWSRTLKEMFDGLVYGAGTGLVFMFFWPGSSAG